MNKFFIIGFIMENKLIEIVAEALEIDQDMARNDLVLDPEDNWDSIALLSVIASIDEEFDIQLDGDELAACRSLSQILNLLKDNS
jgi:acyl carrier protein